MITRILLALIYGQHSITMPHLVVIQLMRVIKWPRSHSHCNCVNKKGRGYKGFYSMCHIYMTDFAYDGPIFLVPLSLSYAGLPVCMCVYGGGGHYQSIGHHLNFNYVLRERMPAYM